MGGGLYFVKKVASDDVVDKTIRSINSEHMLGKMQAKRLIGDPALIDAKL